MQNLPEKACAGVSFLKCLSVNFTKLLTSGRLLLQYGDQIKLNFFSCLYSVNFSKTDGFTCLRANTVTFAFFRKPPSYLTHDCFGQNQPFAGRSCSSKKASQYSHENTVLGACSFIKSVWQKLKFCTGWYFKRKFGKKLLFGKNLPE